MTKYFKYGRTPHFSWSLGATYDDKILKSCKHFDGRNVIVTTKMDGENTSIYNDYFHARSIDSSNHPSRNYVKQLWGNIKNNIPPGWRICGENLYAEHSIRYENLDSFFEVFSIWNENNECLNWDDTVEYCELLGLCHVPVLYRGLWNEELIKTLWTPEMHDVMEGYVVRIADSFSYDDFGMNIAKFVRPHHVTSSENWKTNWKPNKLKQQ